MEPTYPLRNVVNNAKRRFTRPFDRDEDVEVSDISDAGQLAVQPQQEMEAHPKTNVNSQSTDSNKEEDNEIQPSPGQGFEGTTPN